MLYYWFGSLVQTNLQMIHSVVTFQIFTFYFRYMNIKSVL